MIQLNMMYYMDKIRLMMVDEELKVEHLIKLMSRCIKLYKKMDQFIKIFKMIERKEELEKKDQPDVILNKRLYVLIQLHLKENPIMPVQFIYKSANILEQLKQELIAQGVHIDDQPIHSPNRGSRYEKQTSDTGVIINSEIKSHGSTTFSPLNYKDESMSGHTEMITPGVLHRPIVSPPGRQILFSESTQQIGTTNNTQMNRDLPIISLNRETETSEDVEKSSSFAY